MRQNNCDTRVPMICRHCVILIFAEQRLPMDPFKEAPFPHGEAGQTGSQNDVQAGSGIVQPGAKPRRLPRQIAPCNSVFLPLG
jgi:hypothetical protein